MHRSPLPSAPRPLTRPCPSATPFGGRPVRVLAPVAGMKGLAALGVALALALLACGAGAVRYGDEHFMDASEGVFYAFSAGQVAVVDAETRSVLKEIRVDENGDALVNASGDPLSWADAVYMECPAAPGSEDVRSLIFVNIRDVWTEDSTTPSSDELFTNGASACVPPCRAPTP